MRFLSSSEAVNVAGVKLQDPPPGRRRASSAATALGESSGRPIGHAAMEDEEAVPPPSWEQLDEERRTREAEARRGLDGAVGQDNIRVIPEVSPNAPSLHITPVSAASAPSVEIEPPTPIVPAGGASA